MDFDEYDYLEKTVENPELPKGKEPAAWGDETLKSVDRHRSRSSKHKIDERDSVEHRFRSSKSEGELRSHDRSRERNSFRQRSPSREKDKDRYNSSRDHRDKERNGRGRDRDKDRARDRDQDRRGKREHEKESQREREREQSRRSRSRTERHRSDRDEKDGQRSDHRSDRDEKDGQKSNHRSDRDEKDGHRSDHQSDRDEKDGHRSDHQSDRDEKDGQRSNGKEITDREKESVPKERDHENRRYREKKEVIEPEADPERDQRTVFAYQICLKASERDVYDFFSRAGKVRDVRLIMDRISRRSKGVGYVEFYDAMSVPMAIALSGQILLSQPVMVKPSEAEKNQVQSTSATGGSIGPYSGGARRLYVGNLHTSITEDNLRQVFGAFGPVELVQLPVDETGNCKGFGFVQFARLEDARNSLSLNGQLEIAGRTIKVSAITDQTGAQDFGTNTGDLDDDESGDLSLDPHSRALLMQKLDRSGTASSITSSIPIFNSNALSLPISPMGIPPIISPLGASLPALSGLQFTATAIPSIDIIGAPSNCLLLKNMFDPSIETEPDFEMDIKDDVQDECSKFGNVKHIYVDKNSAGLVYLKFEHTQAAMDAQRALHGRWFAGKMITATFMVPQTYDSRFPDSISV